MNKILPLVLYPVFLILFSMLNFYTSTRYALSAYPFIALGIAWIVWQVISEKQKVFFLVWPAMVFVPLIFTLGNRQPNDSSLGYADVVRNQLDVVRYCEDQNWYQRYINTQFLLWFSLQDETTGYLSEPGKGFEQVWVGESPAQEFYIYYNHGVKSEFDSWLAQHPSEKIKTFVRGHSIYEIWQVKKNPD